MLRNITLSADEELIERARQKAAAQNRSLNDLFRLWLAELTADTDRVSRYDALMAHLEKAHSGRAFTRDEMNER